MMSTWTNKLPVQGDEETYAWMTFWMDTHEQRFAQPSLVFCFNGTFHMVDSSEDAEKMNYRDHNAYFLPREDHLQMYFFALEVPSVPQQAPGSPTHE